MNVHRCVPFGREDQEVEVEEEEEKRKWRAQ
jgi:hypothetical protein